MTNRQSNIIFYSVVSIIIYALIIFYAYPEFYENLSKSEEELSIQEAIDGGEHKRALTIYQQLVEESISGGNELSPETALLYENMADLYSLTGKTDEEKNYYLKSLEIKEQLKKTHVFSLVKTYEKLGSLAESDKQYDQAQMYYEKSLSKKLGSTSAEDDEGMFVSMQNTRERYLRLNNEETIASFKKLGDIHSIKKEYEIAKKYYEKALTTSKETFGEDDIKTLDIMKLLNRIKL